MVAATLRHKTAFSGVRPLHGPRDMGGVAEVLVEAFRGEMDAAGERAMRDMRLMGQLGPLAWLLDLFVPIGEGFAPGYVWEKDGHIVGNATVRRAPRGRGYLVGNVAVLPEHRGRGIARQLMQACIEHARDGDGEWMALEVRADNTPARNLYQSLGFQQTGAVMHLQRDGAAPLPLPGKPPEGLKVRPPHGGDSGKLYALAQSATPGGLLWAEPLRENEFLLGMDRQLDLWLAGRGEVWRVARCESQIVGAAQAETFRNASEQGRLRMWVKAGQACHAALLESVLAARETRHRPLLIQHPAEDVAALQVIKAFGFQPVRTLAHMRLSLS